MDYVETKSARTIRGFKKAAGKWTYQIRDLEKTINSAECDLVLFATPIHLTRILTLNKPAIRVRYEYQDHGEPRLRDALFSRMEW